MDKDNSVLAWHFVGAMRCGMARPSLPTVLSWFTRDR
jgi:hypothetical protein